MGGGQNLIYADLFASRTPGPSPASTVKRQKYDFAVAYPDPESLPLDDLLESLRQALDEEGRDLAVYPHTQGYPPLREFVAQKLEDDRGIQVPPDDIVLADGSSQPIHMLVEALIDPGDVVLTEDFVYSGTLNILRRFRADVRGVQCDDEGIIPDALESAIQQAVSEGRRPKMIYTIPTFQNPQGWTMTLERRAALLEASRRHGVPIMEDDCYVDLRYDGEDVTSIRSLDDTDHVMYVGSFSKIIAPGIRLGLRDGAPGGARPGAGAQERGRGEPACGAGRSPVRHHQAARPHRRHQRGAAHEAGRDAGCPWRELRLGCGLEPA